MKHLRTILLLLAVCLVQASFSQNLTEKWKEESNFKDKIAQVLADADTEQEAENSIKRLTSDDGLYITAQDKKNIANDYFEKCKKNLAKWDEKLASGKKVSSDDAMYAANYYILGYKKICNQDYSKALEYIKLCPQIPITKMYTVALQYHQNKDKAAAKAAMNFIDKPSSKLSGVASQFGLADVYQEKIMSLIADKKQIIKRAVRSKDFATLLAYIPYNIPEVDSLFCFDRNAVINAMNQNSNNLRGLSTEDVDFLNKCIYKHEMPWTLYAKFDIKEIAKSYPIKLQFMAFAMKDQGSDVSDPEYYRIEHWLNEQCACCSKDNDKSEESRTRNEQDVLDYIKSFQPRNMLASYLVAVMAQVYGQIGKTSYSPITYTTDFKMELYNTTKEIVDQVPLLKNNQALPVTISDNGKVTIKEGRENPDEIAKNIYVPLMNFIWAVYNQNKDK